MLSKKQIIMDGTELEEQQKDGNMVVSYMPSLNEVTHILQSGISDAATTSQVSYSSSKIMNPSCLYMKMIIRIISTGKRFLKIQIALFCFYFIL